LNCSFVLKPAQQLCGNENVLLFSIHTSKPASTVLCTRDVHIVLLCSGVSRAHAMQATTNCQSSRPDYPAIHARLVSGAQQRGQLLWCCRSTPGFKMTSQAITAIIRVLGFDPHAQYCCHATVCMVTPWITMQGHALRPGHTPEAQGHELAVSTAKITLMHMCHLTLHKDSPSVMSAHHNPSCPKAIVKSTTGFSLQPTQLWRQSSDGYSYQQVTDIVVPGSQHCRV
jgi:hypothetical protein